MRIAVASDHAGFALKETLKAHISGHEIIDCGAFSAESVPYPEYGKKAAEVLLSGGCDRILLVCGTGFGISLAANKYRGLRVVNCSEPYTAKLSRLHNDSNGLALGARVVGDELAKMILDTWLETPFLGGRHGERVKSIE